MSDTLKVCYLCGLLLPENDQNEYGECQECVDQSYHVLDA